MTSFFAYLYMYMLTCYVTFVNLSALEGKAYPKGKANVTVYTYAYIHVHTSILPIQCTLQIHVLHVVENITL